MGDDKPFMEECVSCTAPAERPTLTRRLFNSVSLAAGMLGLTGTAKAQGLDVTSTDIDIETEDGVCDSVFIHPTTGSHPGVLIWTDIMGLRPAFRDMGKRLAAEGFSVLVPNPFYRTSKAPFPEGPLDFSNPDSMGPVRAAMGQLVAEGATERDAGTFIEFLDSQPQTDTSKPLGTQGYCMGGPLIMRTAAAYPNRVGAAASFHGGGLVTDQPSSPHLKIPQMNAQLLIAIADNDDERYPDHKDVLRESFAAAGIEAEIEVYKGAMHGWCVPGGRVYNEPAAEKAWARLLALYKGTLFQA